MAIEETRKKIHFIPFEIKKGRDKDTTPPPTVSIVKGAMRFNRALITELNLNGKFIRFYYEPIKQIVGFQFKDQIDQREMKRWKMVRQNGKTGLWTVSISKLLKQFNAGNSAEKSYYLLPVKKYVEMSDPLSRGEVFYFVELVDEIEGHPSPIKVPKLSKVTA